MKIILPEYFFEENLLDEIKANYGIQLAYLGELSWAKQFIVCTGLSFNLRNNEQRS